MLRRNFVKTALAGAASAILLPVGRSAQAVVEPLAVAGSSAARRLIVVFLRGAADGLSIVVPYGDDDYYRARDTIAIGAPGSEDGARLLDHHFALHPALAPLLPRWHSGQLAFVHAAGSPDPTRSHFDAQDYMESGTPGRKTTADGWMNRLIGVLRAAYDPAAAAGHSLSALNIGLTLPRVLAGAQTVASLPSGRAATQPTPLDRPRVSAAFGRLYAGDDKLSRSFRVAQLTQQEMRATLSREAAKEGKEHGAEMQAASNGAPPVQGLVDDAVRLARLMRGDQRIRLAFMAVGGWDTHANQGAARGQLANRLQPLGVGLASLADGLGPALAETVIVVISEFGRTVRQNGNGGTDHGHGNVIWLLGGPVAGGKVYGDWPGLATAGLYEERDLAVTTDFRTVLSAVGRLHLGLGAHQLASVFPGFTDTRVDLEIVRGKP